MLSNFLVFSVRAVSEMLTSRFCSVLIGTVASSVISCLGEMTALMPVNAPVMEFPRRFLDRGLGFAIGWMYW